MSQVDWSKAPEGATHLDPENCMVNCMVNTRWMMNDGGVWYYWPISSIEPTWMVSSLVTPGRIARMIKRPANPQWTGEGLPPVGVRCEAAIPHTSGPGDDRSFIWIEGSVIAYYEIKGKTYAWFAEDDGFYPPNVLEFRPIRTPEQIAAEDREKAIEDIEELISGYSYRHCAEVIYDAGYRKQDQK